MSARPGQCENQIRTCHVSVTSEGLRVVSREKKSTKFFIVEARDENFDCSWRTTAIHQGRARQ